MRYEMFCGGRLVKEIDQVEVPDFEGDPYPSAEAAAEAGRRYRAEMGDRVPVVDGSWRWRLADGREVSDDVAQAMLARRLGA